MRLPRPLLSTVAIVVLSPGGVLAQELMPPEPETLALTPVSERMFDDAAKIVNGLPTSLLPSVGMLLSADSVCTGTLVGCQTFLTAAHCVEDDLNPASYAVFFQHNGFRSISSITVHPQYVGDGSGHDLAVLRLASSADGLGPSSINTFGRLPNNTSGVVAGFGRIGDPFQTFGIKRFGAVRTATCPAPFPASTHVCWNFTAPVGPPGSDSSTCQGDSGGPLFAATSEGDLVVAGVTSFGTNASCLPPISVFDSDVYVDRAWIQQAAGADINTTNCGSLPAAGSANAPILSGLGTITAGNVEDTFLPLHRFVWVTITG